MKRLIGLFVLMMMLGSMAFGATARNMWTSGKIGVTTVESTMTWYWLNDLLSSLNIPMVLAHAKYVKAIAYAKVKTDKPACRQAGLILTLWLNFFVWIIFRLLIKSLTTNVFFVMLCAQDSKSFNAILPSLILCSFYLQSIIMILQPS